MGISWNIYTHSTETASDSDQIGAVMGWEKKGSWNGFGIYFKIFKLGKHFFQASR